MTRDKAIEILPIIIAFAEGKRVQIWDSMKITGTFTRGAWVDAENIGFGSAPLSAYRIVED